MDPLEPLDPLPERAVVLSFDFVTRVDAMPDGVDGAAVVLPRLGSVEDRSVFPFADLPPLGEELEPATG